MNETENIDPNITSEPENTSSTETEKQEYEILPQFAEPIAKIKARCEEEKKKVEQSNQSQDQINKELKYLENIEVTISKIEELLKALPPEGQTELAIGWHISANFKNILANGLWQSKNRATIHNLTSAETMDNLYMSLFMLKGGDQKPVFAVVPRNFLGDTGGGIIRPATEEETQLHPPPERIAKRPQELGYIPPTYLLGEIE